MDIKTQRRKQTKRLLLKNRFFGRLFNPIVASTELYEKEGTDEYCTMTSNGWVTVRSRKDPEFVDMIPLNLVSEETVRKLAYSMGETDESISKREEEIKAYKNKDTVKESNHGN